MRLWRTPGGAAIAGAALMILLLSACSKQQQEEETVLEPLDAEEISGERLWQRITEETNFENYGFWPGHEGLRPGQAPHGQFHNVYVNEPLRSELPVEERTAPHGSIIVKAAFDSSRELTGYTVMAKVDGFNPDAGDWFWASYGTDGEVRAHGAIEGCIQCHAGRRSNDYVIIRQLDRARSPE